MPSRQPRCRASDWPRPARWRAGAASRCRGRRRGRPRRTPPRRAAGIRAAARIEQPDRHRQAGHDPEDLLEVRALGRQQPVERGRRPPRSRRDHLADVGDPLGSKNICSVRHRPMPSAPNSRAVRRSLTVSALVRTGAGDARVGALHQRAEIADQLGLDGRHLAQHHLAGGAVEGDDLALLDLAAGDAHQPAPIVDGERAGAADAGRPMPRATTAAWLVMPPRAVRMPQAACMP